MPAISARGLSKRYELYPSHADRVKQMVVGRWKRYYSEFWALQDVSFEAPAGSVFGIVGQNGAGKTTLLQLVSGITRPTRGTVAVKGRLCALLELGAGFTPDFTGRENAVIYGMVLGLSRAAMLARMPAVEAFADIGDFIDRPVRTYSAGMLLRLAFSVAVNAEADVLVVDEALAVGDVFFQSKCYAKLRELRAQGTTLLVVSHDMALVRSLCTDVAVLDKGRLAYCGEPREAAERYFKLRALSAGNRELGGARGTRMQRYGNGRATLRAYRVNGLDSPEGVDLASGAEALVEAEYVFTEPVQDPVCAIMVKNHQGLELFGENTLFRKMTLGRWAPGDVLKVRFRARLHLNNGPYFLTVTIFQEGPGGEVDYMDRCVDLCQLNVGGGPYPYMGLCNFDGEVTVDRGAA